MTKATELRNIIKEAENDCGKAEGSDSEKRNKLLKVIECLDDLLAGNRELLEITGVVGWALKAKGQAFYELGTLNQDTLCYEKAILAWREALLHLPKSKMRRYVQAGLLLANQHFALGDNNYTLLPQIP